MAIGLVVLVSGKVFIVSGSARNSQVYIWLLLPALFLLFWGGKRKFDFYYLPWGLFLGWVSLSTFWANGSDTDPLSLAKRGLYIAIFIVAVRILLDDKEVYFRRALLWGIALVSIGAFLSLLYQYGILKQSLAYRAFRIDRMGYGEFANYGWPVAAGIFHGAIASWALGLALDKNAGFFRSSFWLTCFSILSIYVLLTYTRGAWIGLAVTSVVVVLMINSRRGWFLLGAGVLLVFIALLMWWDKIIFEIVYRKLSGRGPIWEYFYSVMEGKWLLGYGLGTPFEYKWPGQETISPHAHSLYLQLVYDSGLVSLALLLVGVATISYKAWTLRHEAWVVLAFPALLFSMIAMITDVERIFTRPGDYWVVFWLPVSVLLAVPRHK